jgi:hypothetical protein
MDSDAADHRSTVLGEAARERRIDVLVREVEGRHAAESREQTSAEARDDDAREPRPGRHGCDAPQDERRGNLGFGMRSGDVYGHEGRIGLPQLSLERVTSWS